VVNEAAVLDTSGGPVGAVMEKRSKLWVWLGVLVLALFNYPLLTIANRDLCYEGIPLLIYYLFGVWLLAIVGLFLGKRFLSP
jgi:CDP-diglyceride synthetase